ncbi:MAG: CYTH domain-containing protein [Planctomycetota bacterium]|nr:CYTH domain-containing protein [Planctomycetota bacterium]
MHTETELKWALDAAGHAALAQRLAELLGPPLQLAQENRFYDTADRRLRAAGLSVRVRRENGRLLLTCKGRGQMARDGTGTHRREEWERELPAGSAEPLAELLPERWRAALGDGRLQLLGGFSNRRQQWRDGPHLLCLDDTDFGVRHDYELEIETAQPAAAHARWATLLAAWGIAWEPQPHTKLWRWLALVG